MLASYSMITLTPETVSMHRLVQAIVLARQPDQDQSPAFGGDSPRTTALRWLSDAIPADTDMTGWPLLRALIPHAETVTAQFSSDDQPEILTGSRSCWQRSATRRCARHSWTCRHPASG